MNEKLQMDTEGTFLEKYSAWDDTKNMPYDYKQKGLLQHIMSAPIVNTTNTITRFMLDVYEYAIIFVFRYIDVLKNFKNVHWKNR